MVVFMPILTAEPAVYPEELFGVGRAEVSASHWWVLHTRPRQEKSLARRLHESQVPFFLPLIPNRLRIRGKVVQSYLPLFAGYVFMLASWEEYHLALATRRVARALEVADQARMWDDLEQVYRLIGSGAAVRSEDQLAPGTPVMIQSGPLAGLRGVIVKTASGNRFVVRVDFIQRGASSPFELMGFATHGDEVCALLPFLSTHLTACWSTSFAVDSLAERMCRHDILAMYCRLEPDFMLVIYACRAKAGTGGGPSGST
jgi:transcriptional antiterminator RfaH